LTLEPAAGYPLLEVLGVTRGAIYCSSCNGKVIPSQTKSHRDKVKGVSCQRCGHSNVHVRLKFHGEIVKLYVDQTGRSHSYTTALHDLETINQQIEEKTFNPKEWLPQAIEERRFENAMDTWITRKEKETQDGKLAPSTLGNYQTYSRRYYLTSKHLVGVDVRDIRLKHLQNFYDALPGSAKYKKNVMDGLHTFFRWLNRWGEVKEIPTWPEIAEVVNKGVFTLSYDEQQEELQRIPAEHRDIFEFLMESGLRPAEACALMKIDIDFRKRKGLIRHNYSEAVLRQRVKQKKEYWIVFSNRAWELIQKNVGNQTEFVFMNPATNRGYRYQALNKVWNAYSKSGVELYAATRHSFCTQLIEDGESLKAVQDTARHADPRTTMTYIHPSEERTRQALNRRGRKVISIDEARKK